jgi:hypothetical protein
MVLACCRGRTRRRGPDPTVVTPHDNLDIREGASVDAHNIRVLAVGIRAAMRHDGGRQDECVVPRICSCAKLHSRGR